MMEKSSILFVDPEVQKSVFRANKGSACVTRCAPSLKACCWEELLANKEVLPMQNIKTKVFWMLPLCLACVKHLPGLVSFVPRINPRKGILLLFCFY